jgi:hypothetical protein
VTSATPRLMSRRPSRRSGKFTQVRCAVCYRRLRRWQRLIGGANYFRHPYMTCHYACGIAEEARLRKGSPS